MTPTLSVDADQLKLICDVETTPAVRPAGVDGSVVSGVGVGGGVVVPPVPVQIFEGHGVPRYSQIYEVRVIGPP